MENNNFKNTWGKVNYKVGTNKKEDLEKILNGKIKKTINHFRMYALISTLISAGFIIFLIITALNRRNDPLYLSNNLILCLITLFCLVSSLWSARFLSNYQADMPIKIWLKTRIDKLSKWIRNKSVFYIIPLIIIMTLLSIHVYYEKKIFIEVFASTESIIALVVGLVVGFSVSFFTVSRIKKFHQKNLKYLKELYIDMGE